MNSKIKFSLGLFVLFQFFSCDNKLTTSVEEILGPNIKLFVESDPSGARIFLDGKNTGHLTPDTVQWLEPRNYKLTLKLELFKDTNVVISVNESGFTKVKLDYTRNPNMRGILYCDSNPRGAEVFFGDSSTGVFTPISIKNLYPGLYNVKFKKEGYWDRSTSINVESAKTRYATVNLRDSLVWVNYTTETINFPSDFLTHVAIKPNGIKWISTVSDGVIRFDDKTIQVFNESNSPLPSNNIYMIAIDPSGKKWIGTNLGLAVFDDINWTIYNTSNSGLPTNLIKSLGFDLEGALWIGTLNGGIIKFDGASWTVFNPSNSGLGSSYVKSIIVDAANVKWIATGDAGVFRYDNVIWKFYNRANTVLPSEIRPRPGIPNDNIECVTMDLGGVLWVGCGEQGDLLGGVAAYKGFAYWTPYGVQPSYSIQSIVVDAQNHKWFGNTYGGISKYTGLGITPTDGTWTHYNTGNSKIGEDRIFSITIDGQDNKWIATFGGGLVKYKGN